jgi:hypothetical protein
MNDIDRNFTRAIADLLWLLDGRYPKKPALELVGNRNMLGRDERMILYRGVFDSASNAERLKKRCRSAEVGAGELIIDGHNVLITLESYLSGKRVFRSLDGFVRDTAGLYGSYTFGDLAKRSVELLVSHLGAENPSPEVRVFLDYPVSRSGELASFMRGVLSMRGIRGDVRAVRSPDAEIIRTLEASPATAVATSDTVILDRSARCVDIPGEIVETVFRKDVMDLAALLAGSRGMDERRESQI